MKCTYLIFISTLLTVGLFNNTFSDNSTTCTIDDFSHLNKTIIKEVVVPACYDELIRLIDQAQRDGFKISVAGARHSQGGHAFYPNGIIISLKKLNKILNLDISQKLITVQTGATWQEVQEFLNPHNLAVKVMQFANFFTIGGALSVNANGIDPHYGPLIESVRSLKILLADGSIITASRTENKELFKGAIGGYGLLGIILEVTLEVTDNDIYKKEMTILTLPDYVGFLENSRKEDWSGSGFHFAQMQLQPYAKKLFGKVMSFNYKKIDENILSSKRRKHIKKIRKERLISIKKMGMSFLRKNLWAKMIHWPADGISNGSIVSRNTIMSPHLSHLYITSSKETDLLQEYFVPVQNLIAFMESLETLTKKYAINLMQVAFRYIPQNTESFLSYTQSDRVGVVLFLNQKITPEATQRTKQWTKSLIDTVIRLEGAYYLPIQLHATKEQLQKAYPQIDTFFMLKTHFDPQGLFMNHFCKKYALSS